WELHSDQCLAVLRGHTGWVSALAVSGDGRHALSGSEDGTLRWWDLHAGHGLTVLHGHTHWVSAVALARDGRHALSGSWDGRPPLSGSGARTRRWWALHPGRCLAIFPCEASVAAFALPPHQPPIVVAGLADGQVQFFRLEST